MIKAKKGLLLSVFSLILALVITTSSTYAWFAMNANVSVNNMQITARADSSFLVIEKTASGTGGKIGNISANAISFEPGAGETPTAVFPVTYKNTGTEQAPDWKWQTATGTTYTNGAALNGNYTDVAESTLVNSNYAAKFSFVVGLNPVVSVYDATDLKIASITFADSGNSSLAPALSVVVKATVGGSTVQDVYLDAFTAASITGRNTVLAQTISSDGTPINIDVYVFINGDNSVVTTAHTQAEDLTTFTVGINFTCSAPTQSQNS